MPHAGLPKIETHATSFQSAIAWCVYIGICCLPSSLFSPGFYRVYPPNYLREHAFIADSFEIKYNKDNSQQGRFPMFSRRWVRFSILFVSCFSFFLSMSIAVAKHPFSPEDMLSLKRIGDIQVSPDGQWIAFVVRTPDLKKNSFSTDIWIVSSDGKEQRQLTTHEASDFSPRWLPDNRTLLFLSTRTDSVQIWKIDRTGGEAQQVTDFPLSVENLIVSPSGKKIAFTLRVFPDCDTIQCTKEKLDRKEKQKETGVLYEELFIRHWDTWADGRRSHLFVMDYPDGKPVDVMKGWDADTPSQPFGGPEEFTFTPDEKGIVFTAKNTPGREPWNTNFDLYYLVLDGKSSPKNLTKSNKAWDTSPVFSPDGKTLAYLAMKRPGYESDRFYIHLRDWQTGQERILAKSWDRSPRSIAWSRDGKYIYATASNLGHTSLFKINVTTGTVETLVKEGTIHTPHPVSDGVIFGYDDLKTPVEIRKFHESSNSVRVLTDLNSGLLENVVFGEYEQFRFRGWKNETVYGFILKPAQYEEGKSYPLAFLIHGGPQGSFSNHFHYRWNPEIYAGAGYAVVMIDFHGSTGYGQAFTDSIRGDWGGKPLVDLQRGLSYVLRTYPWVDEDRMCALGASYGGYMINWIAGRWSGRFRCLVNHDGVFDMRMMYYATEELWFPEWEHGGPYWKVPENHEKHNPARYVKNWKTPMLVIHGAHDFRVPLEQGIATFTALQRKGIPSKFLYFPDENHWVLKPANSLQWHRIVLSWLEQWLKK